MPDTSRPAFYELAHTLLPPEVYGALGSRPGGLTNTEAGNRLRRFGPNTLREEHAAPLTLRLLANFTHLMAILLWAGGAIAFVAQMPQLGIAIWLVNVINGAFSFWQEYKAEKATDALKRLLPAFTLVRRDGEEKRIRAEELVPGDVMLLHEGDHISADGRLVEEHELQVDQSTLTGESRPVAKTSERVNGRRPSAPEARNLVFAGTSVASGVGTAVVLATGMDTEFGKIAHLTQTVGDDLSPLQKELKHVTRMVTVIAVSVGLLFFFLSVMLTGLTTAASFVFAVGIIVAFVPEGLLPTVTLSLAIGVQRMARRHALVKRLSAVETLGCTTVICTDKTGTLTENEMTVGSLWVGGRRLNVSGTGYNPKGQISFGDDSVDASQDTDLRQLLIAGALCNEAHLLPPGEEKPRWSALGDPTEAALRAVAIKGGVDPEAELREAPRLSSLPFDSHRQRMSTIHGPSPSRAYVKGAPLELLTLCSHILLNGEERPLGEIWSAQIAGAVDEYARAGLRVLGVAQRRLPNDLTNPSPQAVESDLTFLGLTAMMDPPRPDVAGAVEKCHRAGIKVVMITGDYGLTAESIAERVGIVQGPGHRVLTGSELDTMSDEALRMALQGEVIFARAMPEHKLRVVTVLRDMGHVVAVTGDGVNDAPALRKADIGVAMGISGTDVARESADMVLADDHFASIVNAVEEGRAVYANIKRFVSYIFTSNTTEAVPFALFALSGGRIPPALNVMQILSIDLGTDLLPALALGAEPPEDGVMERPPRDVREHVITMPLQIRSRLFLGMIQGVAAMAAFYYAYWIHGHFGQWTDLPAEGTLYRTASTMTLAAIVATQIGNLFAQRSERGSLFKRGLFTNPLIALGLISEISIILALVYVPALNALFGTAPLPVSSWLPIVALIPLLPLAEAVRRRVATWSDRRVGPSDRSSHDQVRIPSVGALSKARR